MKSKNRFIICSQSHSFSAVRMIAGILLFGVLAGHAQTGQYLFSGSETTITLNPGLYDITAYGAQGGNCYSITGTVAGAGGLGVEMEGEFNFTTTVTLTILVGAGGGGGSIGGGAGSGGGGS